MTTSFKPRNAFQLLALLSIPVWLCTLYFLAIRNDPDHATATTAPAKVVETLPKTRAASVEPTGEAIPTASAPALTPSAPSAALPALIDTQDNLADAMRQARLVLGPSDPNFVSAVREAAIVCSHSAELTDFDEPSSGLKAGMLDGNKIWAVNRLQVLCEGFDASKLGADRSAVDSVPWDAPAPDVVAASRHLIESSNDRYALARAGVALIQRDDLPATQATGLSKLGKRRLAAAWIQATSLATCGMQLGCSSNSALTASYCARVGCPPGTDFRQALASTLAPDDYRAVVSLSDWIKRRQL